jgi:hypothetical protein
MFGDVVAKPGRMAVLERIQDLREQYGIDLAIMNGENVAGGFSITPPLAEQLFAAGIDVMTGGNHTFDKREILPYLAKQPRLLRPANLPPDTPGQGLWLGEVNGAGVAVISLLGRLFMQPADDPFRAADEILRRIETQAKVRLIDFHTETTSEKAALAHYLDGRVTAVVGSHTHVQTADERILPQGAAFITDIGMTGSYSGVIGFAANDAIGRFTLAQGLGRRAELSTGEVLLCAVVIDIDEQTGQARSIQRLSLPHNS